MRSPRDPARWNQALMDYGARVRHYETEVRRVRRRRALCVTRALRYATADGRRRPRALAAAPPRKKREAPFEGSPRYFRGRIVDVLRALPPGGTLPLDALPALIANGHPAPSPETTRDLLDALERAGLATVRNGAASLPE
jgi:A/G-specific adenine glycosylase